jgi:sulfopyruvate decarboxylase subunit beta
MSDLQQFLGQLAEARRPADVVIATMNPAFVWPSISTSDRDLCYVAPMGSVGPLGLGLALARPDVRVVVLDGDGSLLMNLGALVTIGGQAPQNLVHVVIDNGGYAMTGGQPLPGGGAAQLRDLATAAAYRVVGQIDDPAAFSAEDVARLTTEPGPVFLTAQVTTTFDRTFVGEVAQSAQGRRTQGAAGYANLRATLEVAR